ncbi:MAG: substrate-binding domain-containing protein [Chitinophagaceae bacterium]|nr:substrate-binding domain-containing protein [Chitinophagaceae bacterium]
MKKKGFEVYIKNYFWIIISFFLFNSCNSDETASLPDTKDRGTIHISADESFKPVIDSQIQVYESSHPKTKIICHYKPEAECLKDFAVDSIRMVIATRAYTENEQNFMQDSLKVSPEKMVIAYDAIAVIVNPSSADSLFTMEEIRSLVRGTFPKKLTPVFDGTTSTSTVRFMIDSVLKGEALGKNVIGAKKTQELIDYIAKNPNAVGFLGVSWVGNKEDSTQLSFLKKIKIAHIESTDKPGAYVQPVQANIYYRRYPMVRDLVYTLKENYQGLGHGFAFFLTGQRGQLIFKRAYLMPALMQFNVRNANLRE